MTVRSTKRTTLSSRPFHVALRQSKLQSSHSTGQDNSNIEVGYRPNYFQFKTAAKTDCKKSFQAFRAGDSGQRNGCLCMVPGSLQCSDSRSHRSRHQWPLPSSLFTTGLKTLQKAARLCRLRMPKNAPRSTDVFQHVVRLQEAHVYS